MENELAASIQQSLKITSTDNWRDITIIMHEASEKLSPGAMIHVNDFSLFDAMSAIELMDTKMDSGVHYKDQSNMGIADRLRLGYCQISFPSPSDVLATLDDLFILESTYLTGSSITDTLGNSEYFSMTIIEEILQKCNIWNDLIVGAKLNLQAVPDSLSLLMAIIPLSAMKLCALVHGIVTRADIYDDEDFSACYTFDERILHTISTSSILTLLEALEARLLKARGAVAKLKKLGKKKSQLEFLDLDPWIREQDMADSYIEVFLRRTQLRMVLLKIISSLETNTDKVNEKISIAKELLQSILTEQLCLNAKCFAGRVMGYDPSLSHFEVFNGLPRNIPHPSLEDSIEVWVSTLDHLSLAICADLQCTNLQELKLFLVDFSQKQPNILSRSFLLLFMNADNKIFGRYQFSDWLAEDIVRCGVPHVLLSTMEGSEYAAQSTEVVYETLKVYMQSRSRQRLRIEYLLKDWSILQVHAACIDEKFLLEMNIPKSSVPRCLSAWSMEHAIDLCMQYIILGFELELYAPTEYGMMFWYLDYILGVRVQNLNLAYSFAENLKLLSPHSQNKKGMKKKAKGKSPTVSEEDTIKFGFMYTIASTEMLRSVARGFFQLHSVMEHQDMIMSQWKGFGSREICFRHRFAAMQILQFPTCLSYEDYLTNSDYSEFSQTVMCKFIEQCFLKGKEITEQLRSMSAISGSLYESLDSQVQKVANVCTKNIDAVLACNRCCMDAPLSKKAIGSIELDFTTHSFFPIIMCRKSIQKYILEMFTQIRSAFSRTFSATGKNTSIYDAKKLVNANKESIRELIKQPNQNIVFSKTHCPFCARVKDLFQKLSIPIHVIELDQTENGPEIQAILYELTKQSTVPNVFLNGTHIGGCDDTFALHAKNQLLSTVKK